jgi:hypothetical protein
MGMLESSVQAITGKMPKVLDPTAHAIIDYAIAGSFFVAGALLWGRHRRAAIASIACGVAEAATAMITDYPGGVKPLISFHTHGRVDGGLAALVGAMPLALNFKDDEEARWFRLHGIAIATVTGLTDFDRESRSLRGSRDAA